MNIIKMIFILSIFSNYFSIKGDLPTEIKKCPAGDEVCISTLITQILRTYPKGVPSIGLDAVDVIHFTDVVVAEADSSTPVQLNLKFNTLTVRGFENTTILHAVGFDKDLEQPFELSGWIPLLQLNGEYEASGRVLLLPVQGTGEAELQLKDCKFKCKVRAAEDQRNGGKLYAKITKVKCVVDVKGLHVNFQNLFNDQALSDSMNQLININWQDVWHTMGKGINKAVDQVSYSLLSRVALKLPYDDFYLN
ncbi:protein takeout [Scaptodrosophila lebanonensis]|uniref:Protein takeout n=1 Tax=Drosophila lebanonensis TaxID=7225 RepID=A0A6J2TDD1_DROLE|nr:protein takeout [Scaptodrosophila lebanonensis]